MHEFLGSVLAAYRDNIKSAGNIRQLFFLNVSFGGPSNQFLLRRRHGFLRRTEPGTPAHLHFNKNENVPVFRDNIDLTMIENIIPVKDGKPLPP